MRNTIELCKQAAIASTTFELTNTELKRKYIISNILLYNYIVSKLKESLGTFGTGYPFYGLNPDLTGKLPIIEEQIRYNNELLEEATKCTCSEWTCAHCLEIHYQEMADLKVKCKPCQNVVNGLKPRKIINRLPDMDLWTICKKDDVETAKVQLEKLFNEHNFTTSDVNPVQTIIDFTKTAEELKNGIMPNRTLPLDAHIIDYETLASLIESVPATIEQAIKKGEIPYLPIHPTSLRKTWQQDDEPYNFIYDYLSALTDFNIDKDLKKLLTETRKFIATTYSTEELYNITLQSGTEASQRRNKELALKRNFERRIESWKK